MKLKFEKLSPSPCSHQKVRIPLKLKLEFQITFFFGGGGDLAVFPCWFNSGVILTYIWNSIMSTLIFPANMLSQLISFRNNVFEIADVLLKRKQEAWIWSENSFFFPSKVRKCHQHTAGAKRSVVSQFWCRWAQEGQKLALHQQNVHTHTHTFTFTRSALTL